MTRKEEHDNFNANRSNLPEIDNCDDVPDDVYNMYSVSSTFGGPY